MDLMKLNELQKETIFMRMLSGGNLKSCRQVCSSWNKYIQELWETKRGLRAFKFTLNQNWRYPLYKLIGDKVEMKYLLSETYMRLPFNGFIDKVSQEKICLRE